MRRLLLVRHASTDAVRAAAFGADEPLDAAGVVAAARLRGRLPRAAEVLVSPAVRARATAARAGLRVSAVDAALAECDFGAWAGLPLRAVQEQALRAWMSDPDFSPPGGESLSALLARVGDWLAAQASRSGTAVAITHGGVIKAAVVTALAAPPAAFWRIDIAPLSITELHAHDGRWTVARVNDREERPTAGAGGQGTAPAGDHAAVMPAGPREVVA